MTKDDIHHNEAKKAKLNEWRKARKASVVDKINTSSIPYKIRLVFGLANAIEWLRVDVTRDIRAVAVTEGLVSKDENLRGYWNALDNMIRAVNQMSYWFDKWVEPNIQMLSEDDKTGKIDAEVYDRLNNDSKEIVRLIMAYFDRKISPNLIDEIMKQKSFGIFSEEDFKRFEIQTNEEDHEK